MCTWTLKTRSKEGRLGQRKLARFAFKRYFWRKSLQLADSRGLWIREQGRSCGATIYIILRTPDIKPYDFFIFFSPSPQLFLCVSVVNFCPSYSSTLRTRRLKHRKIKLPRLTSSHLRTCHLYCNVPTNVRWP